MSQFLTLLPLLLALGVLTALLKLLARLWKRTALSWPAAAGYVGLVMVATMLAGILRADSTLPVLAALAMGIVMHGSLGGVYLGRLGKDSQGARLGFKRGALFALGYVGLIGSVTIIPALIYFALRT